MAITVLIPTALRPFAGRQSSMEVQAGTVAEALEALTSRYEELRLHLYGEGRRLRSFVNVYVNQEDIRQLAQENTPLRDGDTVTIVPSIAGGSGAVARLPAAGTLQLAPATARSRGLGCCRGGVPPALVRAAVASVGAGCNLPLPPRRFGAKRH